MKQLLLISLLFISLNGQTETLITNTQKLATTAKVWGFLKYYHPQIAKGKKDWDEHLFYAFKAIESITTKEELNQFYSQWIKSLGKIKPCKKCAGSSENEYFNKNFDLSWTDDTTTFTKVVINQLELIEWNRYQGKPYYAKKHSPFLNIANFENEKTYDSTVWKEEKFRLLTLFRYWNQVEYYFPYKYQMDIEWDQTLNDLIPRFIQVSSQTEYELLLLEMIVRVDDSHAVLMTDSISHSFGTKFLPVFPEFIQNEVVITSIINDSLAHLNQLQLGDIITQIDGIPVETIYQENKKYVWGSNDNMKRHNSFIPLAKSNKDSVEVQLKRDGKKLILYSSLYTMHELRWKRDQPEVYKILPNNIGYLNMGQLELKDVDWIMDSLADTDGLILDVRNYPKGTMYKVVNRITYPTKEFVTFTHPDLNYPGKFVWDKPYSCGNNQALKYTKPVVVLTDNNAQSHAEFTVMALQTGNNVTTIGSQTSGADGNVTSFELVGGYKTRFTGLGVFYPDRSETQRIGIHIDEYVYPTPLGIAEGRDELIERAVEIILGSI